MPIDADRRSPFAGILKRSTQRVANYKEPLLSLCTEISFSNLAEALVESLYRDFALTVSHRNHANQSLIDTFPGKSACRDGRTCCSCVEDHCMAHGPLLEWNRRLSSTACGDFRVVILRFGAARPLCSTEACVF